MRIESGPSKGMRNNLLLWAGLCLAAGGWFAYDGWIGYPKSNEAERRRLLPPDAPAELAISPHVTDALAGKSYDEVRAAAGTEPVRLKTGHARFDGPDGMILVGSDPGERATWQKLSHTLDEIQVQKILAGVLGVVGLLVLARAAWMMSRRTILDDAGLHTRDGRMIAWNRMTRLDCSRLDDAGWVDLEYDDAGKPSRYRIDSHAVAEFDAIVDEICTRKGWPNPLSGAGESTA